ncbi:MAG: hypothetical protein MK081_07175 [Flavobacteriales bacterium]|nr:hypothetical protein [Flavobacteriales bacterium]
MKLALNTDQTIGGFREQFNQLFPRLSIQLFTQPHGVGEGSPAAEKVDECDRSLCAGRTHLFQKPH